MAARFDLVTFDVPDPRSTAGFWCAALGLVVVEDEDDGRWVALADDSGRRVLGLQRGPVRPGGVHLDLSCDLDGFASELDRLVGLGATPCQPVRAEPYGRIANLADPDGYLFDLCAYGP